MARISLRSDVRDNALILQEQLTDQEVTPPCSEWHKFCCDLQEVIQAALPGVYLRNFEYIPIHRKFSFVVVASWVFKHTIFLTLKEEYFLSLDLNLTSQLEEIVKSVKQLKKFGENIYKTANPHVPR